MRIGYEAKESNPKRNLMATEVPESIAFGSDGRDRSKTSNL